jgi:hypothetical protein
MENLNNRNACYFLYIEHFLAGAEAEYYKSQGIQTFGKSITEGWGRSLKQAKKNAKTVYTGNCDLSCIMDEKKVIVNGRTVIDTTIKWAKKK